MLEKLSIVGIGGTTVADSSTEQALIIALEAARAEGADVTLFDGPFLAALPHYSHRATESSDEALRLVAAVRGAHGLLLASPGYHGSVSGLFKNAIDYIEETAKDARVYLDGLPVGLIATAYGWQATGSTLATMRSIVHALRGWPTPLGAGIRSVTGMFSNNQCCDEPASSQLQLVGRQVVEFARLRRAAPSILSTGPLEE